MSMLDIAHIKKKKKKSHIESMKYMEAFYRNEGGNREDLQHVASPPLPLNRPHCIYHLRPRSLGN